MYRASRLNLLTIRALRRIPMPFGLAASGPGAEEITFMYMVIGTTQERGILMYVATGNMQVTVTGGTEGTGDK